MPKILIVEDNVENRDSLSRRLQRRGYEVLTAEDGKAGLAMAQAEKPDLVLMDMNMPELDGWATLRLLRADDQTAGVCVAMFSVKSEVRDKVSALKDGAVDYITKPFGVDELIGRVHRILDAAGSSRNPVPSASGS